MPAGQGTGTGAPWGQKWPLRQGPFSGNKVLLGDGTGLLEFPSQYWPASQGPVKEELYTFVLNNTCSVSLNW